MNNGGSSNEGGSGGEGNGEGNSTGNVGEGGDNVNGSSEAATEGIILIVFIFLMKCLYRIK